MIIGYLDSGSRLGGFGFRVCGSRCYQDLSSVCPDVSGCCWEVVKFRSVLTSFVGFQDCILCFDSVSGCRDSAPYRATITRKPLCLPCEYPEWSGRTV